MCNEAFSRRDELFAEDFSVVADINGKRTLPKHEVLDFGRVRMLAGHLPQLGDETIDLVLSSAA
jgi:hypothetical protein